MYSVNSVGQCVSEPEPIYRFTEYTGFADSPELDGKEKRAYDDHYSKPCSKYGWPAGS